MTKITYRCSFYLTCLRSPLLLREVTPRCMCDLNFSQDLLKICNHTPSLSKHQTVSNSNCLWLLLWTGCNSEGIQQKSFRHTARCHTNLLYTLSLISLKCSHFCVQIWRYLASFHSDTEPITVHLLTISETIFSQCSSSIQVQSERSLCPIIPGSPQICCRNLPSLSQKLVKGKKNKKPGQFAN